LPRKRDPAPRSTEHRDPDGRKAAPRPLRGVAIAPARRPPQGGARPLRSRRGRYAALDPGPRLPADRALGRRTPYGGGGRQDPPVGMPDPKRATPVRDRTSGPPVPNRRIMQRAQAESRRASCDDVAWWRAGQEIHLAESEDPGSRVTLWALMAFTFVLLLAPQAFLPALAPLHLGVLTAAVAITTYLVDR